MKHSFLFALTIAASVVSSFAVVNYPYPQEVNYANGIRATVANQSTTLKTKFQTFLTNHYAEQGDLARITFDDSQYTVSEGIGYGMIMMVYFSDNTTSYQSHFDKLWAYYKKYENSNGLMNWKIQGFGSVVGENGALDADEDVAFALVMAYYQFGDEKYLTDAKTLIAAIREKEFNTPSYLHRVGDMWDPYKNPSYVSPAEYKIFASVDTVPAFWSNVISANYTLLKANQNANTGLPSGWSNDQGTPINGNNGSGIAYDYDSPRAPWRWAWTYAWFGDTDAATLLSKLGSWVNSKTVSALKIPMALNDGGTTYETGYSNAAAVGPLTCTLMYSSNYSANLNSFTKTFLSKGVESYFNDALQVLSGLLLTGNMPNLAAMNPNSSSSSSVASSSSVKSSSSVAPSSSSVKSSSSVAPSSSSVESSSSVAPSSSSVKSSSSVAPSSSSVESSSSVAPSSSSVSSSSAVNSSSSVSTAGYTVKGSLSQSVAKGQNMETITITGVTSFSRDTWTLSSLGQLTVEQSGTTVTISGKVETWAQAGNYTETLTINGEKVTISLSVVNGSDASSSSASDASSCSANDASSSSSDKTAIANVSVTKALNVAFVGRSLEIASATPVKVSVFDMQGALLKSVPQATSSVSLESMPRGSYIVRVQAGSTNWTKRISIR